MLLDGRKTADILNEALRVKVQYLTKKPKLEIILIGNDEASKSYVKGKLNTASNLGMEVHINYLDEAIDQLSVEALIQKLNTDKGVHGILLQLPIPKHLDSDYLISLIDYKKDVDGFHTMNQGLLFQKKDGIRPATPLGIMMLLDFYNIPIEGKHVVIIGRSQIVGAPLSKMFLDRNATVTITHSKTKNLPSITKQADILVAAIGKPKFVTKDMVKVGAVVVDVGINRVDKKLVGDVDFEHVEPIASYITPVPKGVGPMTICALAHNLYALYLKQEKE
ncbi:bifunctional 5,10-methylenetetrahydrofolate dehydrogenase/5,10-methenyltetrahydrofolate cyclohydrolase [Acholeplasma laidlawii]|jgi:methylenetetrahydrofolate dehydrogenase (NADP+)/methenyltetrahydrofolate cyclohydrolase|uniref:Bifunctional protein FolD n=1 Tax=Acholeplasma laidlawii (strain PG-8A) TaxID=441768 RepID=FOLD_ACHLI|nr:bifunctional 5,10-methylenetetrahydrofolate dehydrogenase/5,10-methenyltetrahydrofolate cyclohydrolase [Acholeplasma laidlawii]A9NE96.1 RecName: Full=Bifunctional protein FolD; Includes: RecName: Full=Methylenetetrahydrofolate dehydrogenase; Includes: RecName: Full=Methenyltetrahydrofolate cyclohydrolase [Acholeplasma laidlawii PG-8A]ABX80676.1 methylenetetrahydrofolate dehydrogenase (NADP+) [Acholeplasma laidlawii PG-8A]RED19128.1 methylenetetrahydrofolate dehydrogenase (NADP+)/methenyltetra